MDLAHPITPMTPTTPKIMPTVDVTVPYNELSCLKRIGVGFFSVVYKARHVSWGCDVAYKKFKIDFVDPVSNLDEAKYVRFLYLQSYFVLA